MNTSSPNIIGNLPENLEGESLSPPEDSGEFLKERKKVLDSIYALSGELLITRESEGREIMMQKAQAESEISVGEPLKIKLSPYQSPLNLVPLTVERNKNIEITLDSGLKITVNRADSDTINCVFNYQGQELGMVQLLTENNVVNNEYLNSALNDEQVVDIMLGLEICFDKEQNLVYLYNGDSDREQTIGIRNYLKGKKEEVMRAQLDACEIDWEGIQSREPNEQVYTESREPIQLRAAPVNDFTDSALLPYMTREQQDHFKQAGSEGQVEAIVSRIEGLYQNFCAQMRYNNGETLLEFVAFYRQAKQLRPDLSWADAFEHFQSHAVQNVDKYNGGNCFTLGMKFIDLLRQELGIEGYLVGSKGFNRAFQLPDPQTINLPKEQRKMINLSQTLDFAERSHGAVMVAFNVPGSEDKEYLLLEMGYPQGMSYLQRFNADNLLQAAEKYYDPAEEIKPDLGISNADESVIKNILRAKNSIVIDDVPEARHKMIIDILRGRILLDLEEIPAGERPIDVRYLLKTNKAYLIKQLEIIRQAFSLPDDFIENIIFLFENREEYYHQFMGEESKNIFDQFKNVLK